MMANAQQIVWFEEIRRHDVPRVGGKNASLGEMVGNLAAEGVKVPAGFATTADAYWRFIDSNGLRVVISSNSRRSRSPAHHALRSWFSASRRLSAWRLVAGNGRRDHGRLP